MINPNEQIAINIFKAFGGDIQKGGEGSKGGKIIGHTKSGKPIYDTHGHEGHKDFNEQDHRDAMLEHTKIQNYQHAKGNHDQKDYHRDQRLKHEKSAHDASEKEKRDKWTPEQKKEVANHLHNVLRKVQGKDDSDKMSKSFPDKGDPDYIEKDKGKEKVKKVMDEWKSGKLNSSSGDPVKDRKQAIAIALSEAGLSKSMDDEEVEKAYNENKDLFSDYEEKEEKDEDKVSKAFESLGVSQPVPDMNSQASSFMSKLMSMQQSATITHRYQLDRKISTHLALGEFYEELDPMIDELIETYQGYYNTQLNVSSNGGLMNNPTQDIKDFCDYIDQSRGFCSASFIQNQIDNIMALITRTLYKLNFVQS